VNSNLIGQNASDEVILGSSAAYNVKTSIPFYTLSTANPGLTVGDGTTGYLKVGGSTVSDAAGNLTLDSDTGTVSLATGDGLIVPGNTRIGSTSAPTAALSVGDATNYLNVSSSGALTYAGTARPKRTIVLTPGGALLDPSDGPTRTTTDGTNFTYVTLDFSSSSTTKNASWDFAIPDSYDAASEVPLNVHVYWTATGASATATWGVMAVGRGNNAALDAAGTTLSATCTASSTANNLNVCSLGTLSPSWTNAAFAAVKITRTGGTETTPKLVMIKLEWTASKESD